MEIISFLILIWLIFIFDFKLELENIRISWIVMGIFRLFYYNKIS